MTLSGTLWPVHLKPFEDELLSSWLVRLVRANFMSYRTFFELSMQKKTDRNKDIDRSADIETVEDFAVKTGTAFDRVYRTTLRAYEGIIYEKHNSQGGTNWIMPIGRHGSLMMRYGLQCCPLCLSEGEPYFRRSWRLAFITVCTHHGNLLIDHCPKCGDSISFYKTPVEKESITLCKQCGYDLRDFHPDMARGSLLNIQLRLQHTVNTGWFMLEGYGPIYSHLYFKVLHQVTRRLCIGKRSLLFREAVQQELVGLPRLGKLFAKVNSHIERLCIADRAILVEAAVWLLNDWPSRLVRICKASGLGRTEITYNMPLVPFWFTHAVNLVDKTPYIVSTEEMASAVNFLKIHGNRINNMSINRFMGRGIKTKKREYAVESSKTS